MIKYIFHPDYLPEEEFSRVHALLVTGDERILMRVKNGEPRITGGHIDPDDVDMYAALGREVLEEINCEIDRVTYVGYLEMIDEDTGEHEFWARMIALVSKILPPRADPDREEEWIYGRILAPIEVATEELAQAFPTNREFVKEALKVAREQDFWTDLPSEEYEVLNTEKHS